MSGGLAAGVRAQMDLDLELDRVPVERRRREARLRRSGGASSSTRPSPPDCRRTRHLVRLRVGVHGSDRAASRQRECPGRTSSAPRIARGRADVGTDGATPHRGRRTRRPARARPPAPRPDPCRCPRAADRPGRRQPERPEWRRTRSLSASSFHRPREPRRRES